MEAKDVKQAFDFIGDYIDILENKVEEQSKTIREQNKIIKVFQDQLNENGWENK